MLNACGCSKAQGWLALQSVLVIDDASDGLGIQRTDSDAGIYEGTTPR